MSDIVIRAEGLGKRYRIGLQKAPYKTLREAVTGFALAPARKLRTLTQGNLIRGEPETIWALKDVDLEVRRGEVLGVIGSNGAGKSTLLKILARITEPTTGRVELQGRIGSLLEVGTGFHPELTGRENIFLNGAILGMKKAEIDRRFDEIVAFAEIERFLDTPVKRYSSGMYVRLAFAVAAHMEPEILLIDEVMAVGDNRFQNKCIGKVGDLATEGRTVLIVSHNMALVNRFCERAVLLVEGSIRRSGPTSEVTAFHLGDGETGGSVTFNNDSSDRMKSWPFVFTSLDIIDECGGLRNRASRGERLFVRLRLEVRDASAPITVGYSLFDAMGHHIYRCLHTDHVAKNGCVLVEGPNAIVSELPIDILNEGRYFVVPDGSEHRKRWLYNPNEEQSHACKIEIVGPLSESGLWQGRRAGILAPCIPWFIGGE